MVERYYYDAYGKSHIADPTTWSEIQWSDSCENTVGYAGYGLDAETGLLCTQLREYHCTLGTFIEVDPGRYVDGMNVYQYCRSNPAALTDPTGLCGGTAYDPYAWTDEDFEAWKAEEDGGGQWTDSQLASYNNYIATTQDFFGNGNGLPPEIPNVDALVPYHHVPDCPWILEAPENDTGAGSLLGPLLAQVWLPYRILNEAEVFSNHLQEAKDLLNCSYAEAAPRAAFMYGVDRVQQILPGLPLVKAELENQTRYDTGSFFTGPSLTETTEAEKWLLRGMGAVELGLAFLGAKFAAPEVSRIGVPGEIAVPIEQAPGWRTTVLPEGDQLFGPRRELVGPTGLGPLEPADPSWITPPPSSRINPLPPPDYYKYKPN